MTYCVKLHSLDLCIGILAKLSSFPYVAFFPQNN